MERKALATRASRSVLIRGRPELLVFDADAPEDVACLRGRTEPAAEELRHPSRALGQHLKGVPVGGEHDLADLRNVVVGSTLVEEV